MTQRDKAIKELKAPVRRQIQEHASQEKKSVEPAGIKIENNVPIINFYGSQPRDKITKKNNSGI